MNNYLPLLVQNESFSQPLSLQPLTPGDTLRREGGGGRTISTESTSNLYKPWQPQPPFRNSYNNSTIPPPPLPFHAWKPGRAMFISLFFFLFLSLSLSSPFSIPLGSSSFASIANPSYTRRRYTSRHYQTTTLSTTTLPPPPVSPFRTRGKPPPSNELRG